MVSNLIASPSFSQSLWLGARVIQCWWRSPRPTVVAGGWGWRRWSWNSTKIIWPRMWEDWITQGKTGLLWTKEGYNKRLGRGQLVFIIKDFWNLLGEILITLSRTNDFFIFLKPETSRQGGASQGKVRSSCDPLGVRSCGPLYLWQFRFESQL